MALSSQLSDALSTFTQNRTANLLAAGDSLSLLVDLTAELSKQLCAIGGPRATSILACSQAPHVDAPARQTPTQTEPNLYRTVEDTVQMICASYEAFTAARASGKFKKEVKHFEAMLPLGELNPRCAVHNFRFSSCSTDLRLSILQWQS